MTNHLGKTVRAVQQGNWIYRGVVVEEDATDTFLTILDAKTGRRVQLRRDSLLVLEVLDDG